MDAAAELANIPLRLPFLHEFAEGYVASASSMERSAAQKILESLEYRPDIKGNTVGIRPIFHWVKKTPDFHIKIIFGQPTDQSELDWDYPCGLLMSLDYTCVFACIDRTLTKNAWWRILDPTGWIFASKPDKYLLACNKVAISTESP